MSEKEKKQKEADLKRVGAFLSTSEGQFFLEWMGHEAGVDAPTINLPNLRNNPAAEQVESQIREGGRQLCIRLKNITDQHQKKS